MAFLQVACERQTYKLRIVFFKALLRQNIGWYDEKQSGELTTRLADDLERIQEGTGTKIGLTFQMLAQFVSGFVVGFVKGWKMTLVIMSVSPLLVIFAAIIGKVMTSFAAMEQQKYSKAGAIAEEVLSCIRTVTSFNGQTQEIKKYGSALQESMRVGIKKSFITGLSVGTTMLVMFGAYGLGFWFGSTQVDDYYKSNGEDGLAPGEVMTVFFGVMVGSFALGGASPHLTLVMTAKGAAGTIYSIIKDYKPAELDMAFHNISSHKGKVCFLFLCLTTAIFMSLYKYYENQLFIFRVANIFETQGQRAQDKVSIPLNTSQVDVHFDLPFLGRNSTDHAVDQFIQFLTEDLKYKLEKVIPGEKMEVAESCTNQILRNKSCDKSGCLQLKLPKSLNSRVAQLVKPPHLHYSDHYQKVFEDMADSVPGYYDLILLTGASSNHYLESKTLLYHLHKFVYPHLHNFTLIFYDLGLTETEREDISRKCKCHVRLFPFSRFPKIFSFLKCYAWKPMIVNAHAPRCNLVHWVDASIRFSETKNFFQLKTLYQRARSYGVQSGCLGGLMPRVTLPSMPHFFGDELCVYHPFKDITAGFMIFHNEPLVREAILRPWSACALHADCMCPHKKVKIQDVVYCPQRWDEFIYALCHRFEQSALNIILRKLFQEKSLHLLREDILDHIDIKRGDKSHAENL